MNESTAIESQMLFPRDELKRDKLLVLLVGLLSVISYVPLLTSGSLVLPESPYSDYSSYQLPLREFAQDEFMQGRFPHWVPWIGCGLPMHATQQTGLCYPFLTPLLFLFSANMSIKLSVFLHAIICYAGQYRLGRTLSLSRQGASISALIATQSGFATAHLAVGHISLVCAYALVPWLFHFVLQCSRLPKLQNMCGVSAVTGLLLLVGHPQIPYYAFLFSGIMAAIVLVVGRNVINRRRSAVYLVGGVLLGVILAAVQLIPTAALILQQTVSGERGTLAHAEMYHLTVVDVYRQLIPSLWGNPVLGQPEFAPLDFFHEKIAYLGVLTCLLAGTSLITFHHRRWPWLFGALSLLCLLIALGSETPVFALLYQTIPGIGLFRCPGRCLSIASVLVAALAGRGFDSWNVGNKLVGRRSLALMGFGLIGGLIGLTYTVPPYLEAVDWNAWQSFSRSHLSVDLTMSALFLLASLGVIWLISYQPRRVALLFIIVLLVVDLGYFNMQSLRLEPDATEKEFKIVSSDLNEYRIIDSDFSRQAGAARYSRLVPIAIRTRVRIVGTNEGGVLPDASETLFQALDRNSEAALRASACRYLVKPELNLQEASGLPLPRIWICPEEHVQLCDVALTDLDNADIDRLWGALVTSGSEIQIDQPQRLQIRIDTTSSGKVIIADTWYPGWQATVDGAPVPVELAFGCFRAIPVESGSHLIEVSYHSPEFPFAAGASLTALGIWLLLIGTALRRQS
ncbi:MAG: hypothetical protein KDA69_01745 [Planctomycetaceae bacterium]|nr:hypothetical protein [Planctomycetaceae bacterium]